MEQNLFVCMCLHVCVHTDIPPTLQRCLPKTWFSSATLQQSTIAMYTCSQSVKVAQQGPPQYVLIYSPAKVQKTHVNSCNCMVNLVPNIRYIARFFISLTPHYSYTGFVLDTQTERYFCQVWHPVTVLFTAGNVPAPHRMKLMSSLKNQLLGNGIATLDL